MNGINFIKFHNCMQKWYEFGFKRRYFLSEHAAVYFLSVKILFATEYQLTEYQLNNDITITSFCFVNKSAAEEHPETEVSASEYLGRVTTRVQDAICKSIANNFRKRLRACVNADGGHFEHLL